MMYDDLDKLLKEDNIRKVAYVIWKERKRRGEEDADDSVKNWNLAISRLYSQYYLGSPQKSLSRRMGRV
jgi:hypothetical protein